MKKLFHFCTIFIFAFFILSLFPLISTAELPISVQKQMHIMLQNAMPAVVNIVCQGEFSFITDPFLRRELERMRGSRLPEKRHFTSVGSGVIIDAKQGLIVTNAHVIDQSKTITITLNDGRRYEAETVGTDDVSDIAVLQIHADHLTAIPFANSNDVEVGDFVAAIGSPFGLDQTVTSGIVSGLHRTGLGIESVENFIQTDAPINMGNSGGALVNIQGQLVGINTALLSSNGGNIGIGFAIPANMVKSIIQQIILYGKVHRGLMGVLVQTLTPDLADAFNIPHTKGAIIAQIMPNSPAEKAGLKTGDIITYLNQQRIQTSGDVHNTISLVRAGQSVNLRILRNNKTMDFSFKTADPVSTEQLYTSPYLNGISMKNTGEQSPKHGYVEGVKISDVDPYSVAWIAGLRPGDIVVSANQQPVKNIKELEKIAEKPSKTGLLLNIFRGEGAGFVVIKP